MVKFSVYLNRRAFVMQPMYSTEHSKSVRLLQFFIVRTSVIVNVQFCFVIVLNLFSVPRENCASWLWPILGNSIWASGFLLFLHDNICCWYSLEGLWRGTFCGYHNICFHREVRKISVLCNGNYLALSEVMFYSKVHSSRCGFFLPKRYDIFLAISITVTVFAEK